MCCLPTLKHSLKPARSTATAPLERYSYTLTTCLLGSLGRIRSSSQAASSQGQLISRTVLWSPRTDRLRLWRPIVGIDAFDLREDEIDITPWLTLLCDGLSHVFTVKVTGLSGDHNGTAKLSDTVGNYWVVTGKVL